MIKTIRYLLVLGAFEKWKVTWLGLSLDGLFNYVTGCLDNHGGLIGISGRRCWRLLV